MSTHDVTAPRLRARAIAGEQLLVAAGQAAAGVGNLAFALIAARLLAPTAFAELAAFLALYLLIHVPTASLSAGSALTPALAARARWRVLAIGVAAGAAIAAAGPQLAPVLHLPVELVWALAAAAPTSGLIALERGRLYGSGRRGRAVASLAAEPLVRLGAGVAALSAFGAIGGAIAVVAAGWAALAVAGFERPRVLEDRAAPSADAAAAARAGVAVTVAAFLLLAVIQNQDVLLANALLTRGEAASFAVLSTLGGVAAFATTTVPLVLLPRAAAGERGALGAALAVAAALGAAAVAVVTIAPPDLVGQVFGHRYDQVGVLAGPYLVAMALLGIARVLVAHACARGRGRAMLVVLAGAAALQAALIVLLGTDARSVSHATLIATAALTAGAGGAAVLQLRPRPIRAERVATATARRRIDPSIVIVALAVAVGLTLRLVATRGIWLDEATSIHQAQMPFGQMITTLRDTDVHPPLHHAVLWLTVRVFGTTPLAVRAPSLLAGTLLIPMLYVAGRDIYDRRAGVAAAVLGAVAPFAIWYSDEARMYAFFMLFALVALWAQVRVLREGRPRHWVIYVLATAAMVWNQYFALLFVAVQQGAFAIYAVRRRGRLLAGWLLSLVAIAALLAPLVPFALHQFSVNESAGKGFESVPSQAGQSVSEGAKPSVYGAITNALWAMLGYHTDATMARLTALWPLLLLLGLLLLGRGRSRTTLLLVALVALPATALFGLGQLKPFVFEVRYFVAAVPVALLLTARALTSWTNSRGGGAALVAVTATVLLAGVADQQWNGTNPRLYDFGGALAIVRDHARPGDTVVYAPKYLTDVVSYYGGGRVNAQPLGRRVPTPAPGHRVFVIGSFLNKPDTAAQVGRVLSLLRAHHHLVGSFERPQIRVWEFA